MKVRERASLFCQVLLAIYRIVTSVASELCRDKSELVTRMNKSNVCAQSLGRLNAPGAKMRFKNGRLLVTAATYICRFPYSFCAFPESTWSH